MESKCGDPAISRYFGPGVGHAWRTMDNWPWVIFVYLGQNLTGVINMRGQRADLPFPQYEQFLPQGYDCDEVNNLITAGSAEWADEYNLFGPWA